MNYVRVLLKDLINLICFYFNKKLNFILANPYYYYYFLEYLCFRITYFSCSFLVKLSPAFFFRFFLPKFSDWLVNRNATC